MAHLERWTFHPLLIGVYPVLALLANNVDQIRASAAMRSLVGSFVAASILLILLRLLIKDRARAAILCTMVLLLFYSYGHVYHYLETNAVLGMFLGRHRLLVPVWLVLMAGGTWLALKGWRDVAKFTITLNVMTLVAFAFPVIQIITFEARISGAWSDPQPLPVDVSGLHLPGEGSPPDIYYIILDAYARDDVLRERFGFDNTAFLDELAEMGFYVARCSQSNYAQTELSLASSLNFDYLDSLGDDFVSGNTDRSGLWPLIRHSATRRMLEDLGYHIVAFETGYYWTHLDDADFYFSAEKAATDKGESLLAVNGFEAMLIRTSAGLILTDVATIIPRFLMPDMDYPNRAHRERVLYTFDMLKSTPTSVQSPKFVFAHIVAPHFPYVFGPNGEWVTVPEPIDESKFVSGYRDQVAYVNERILILLREIIGVSATPPVIILQADHGQDRGGVSERMAILNAYYLPDGGGRDLYESISPVNSFRVVFNAYFEGQFELLEDNSYYSIYQDPYNYEIVPLLRTSCGGR